jgi:hypothetical protein
VFPGSSVVEQPAVNRLVAGSNPARGAKVFKRLDEIQSGEQDVGAPFGAPRWAASGARGLAFPEPGYIRRPATGQRTTRHG